MNWILSEGIGTRGTEVHEAKARTHIDVKEIRNRKVKLFLVTLVTLRNNYWYLYIGTNSTVSCMLVYFYRIMHTRTTVSCMLVILPYHAIGATVWYVLLNIPYHAC